MVIPSLTDLKVTHKRYTQEEVKKIKGLPYRIQIIAETIDSQNIL